MPGAHPVQEYHPCPRSVVQAENCRFPLEACAAFGIADDARRKDHGNNRRVEAVALGLVDLAYASRPAHHTQ